MARNSRLWQDALAHIKQFEGDEAECNQWYGWAKQKLGFMLKTNPGATSATFFPTDSVMVKVDTRPNRITIQAGAAEFTYLTKRYTDSSGQLMAPDAKTNKLLELKKSDKNNKFPYGMPIMNGVGISYAASFWRTAENKFAIAFTDPSDSTVGFSYRGKKYSIPSPDPFAELMDVNALNGVVIATTISNSNGYWRVYSSPLSVSGFEFIPLQEVYAFQTTNIFDYRLLVPAIAENCSYVIGGEVPSTDDGLNDNPNVTTVTVNLNNGMFSGASSSSWATGFSIIDAVTSSVPANPANLTTWQPPSYPDITILPYPSIPSRNANVTVNQLWFCSGSNLYAKYTVAGKTGISFPSLPTNIGDTFTDGTSQWLVEGKASDAPGYGVQQYTNIDSGCVVESEYGFMYMGANPSPGGGGEYAYYGPSTLEDSIQYLIDQATGPVEEFYAASVFANKLATRRYNYSRGDDFLSLTLPTDGAVYHVYDNSTDIRGTVLEWNNTAIRTAVLKFSSTTGDPPYYKIVQSYRVYQYFKSARIGGIPNFQSSPSYTVGEKPIGFTRGSSGVIEKVYTKENAFAGANISTGTSGGARITQASVIGYPTFLGSYNVVNTVNYDSTVLAKRPTHTTYSYNILETITKGEYGFYIGIDLQYNYSDSSYTYYYNKQSTGSGRVDNEFTGSSTVVTSSSSTIEYKSKITYSVGGNLQSRIFYVAEHAQTNLVTQITPDVGQDSIQRIRKVILSGEVIYQEDYQVASNATYSGQKVTEYVDLAPIGKPNLNQYLISVYSYQGFYKRNGTQQWSTNLAPTLPAVDDGQFQILIDSNGYKYNVLPTATGNINIDDSWNDDTVGDMVKLNRNTVK